MRSGDAAARRRAGFALVEVLAALAVTAAFVAVALPYAGRLVQRWWVGEAAVTAADAWTQAVARIGDDLAQAVPLGLGAGAARRAAFAADGRAIRFVRTALGRPDRLETITYAIRSSGRGSALVRQSRGFGPEGFTTGGGAEAVLIEGPYHLSLVTVGRDGSRLRAWPGAAEMPAAVELSASPLGTEPVPAAPAVLPIVARSPAVPARPGAP